MYDLATHNISLKRPRKVTAVGPGGGDGEAGSPEEEAYFPLNTLCSLNIFLCIYYLVN